MAKSFDEIELSELFGEAQEVFFEIVVDLKASAPQLINDIKQSIRSENYKDLEHTAHTLKGVLANFAATVSKDLAFELEVIGRNQEKQDLSDKVFILEKFVNELIKDLEDFKFKN